MLYILQYNINSHFKGPIIIKNSFLKNKTYNIINHFFYEFINFFLMKIKKKRLMGISVC